MAPLIQPAAGPPLLGDTKITTIQGTQDVHMLGVTPLPNTLVQLPGTNKERLIKCQ